MSAFTVLGDSAVHEILINLSKDETTWFANELSQALLKFSVDDERQYQPVPGVVRRPDGQKTLFRTFTSPTHVGTKIIVDRTTCAPSTDSEPAAGGKIKGALRGIIALCDNHGVPTGVINAEEVTGYRTSLCALIPFIWRRETANIVIFGAGKQALWHIRLALALRGSEIKKVTIVNRSIDKAQSLKSTLDHDNQSHWKSEAVIDCLSQASDAYEKELENVLGSADVVFCTVPSQSPLFAAKYLSGRLKAKPGVYVSAIGSWQPEMIELDPELLKEVVSAEGYKPEGIEGGSIIIADDADHALQVGEIIQSGLERKQMLELGEIVAMRGQNKDSGLSQDHQSKLNQWLEEGTVIYKSVGVGVMDLIAGNAILSLAAKRNLGTTITDF